MRKKRSRFALLGILALAFTVTAGLTTGEAIAKKKGGGGTKTINKGGAPIPDSTQAPDTDADGASDPSGNGGPPDFHRGVLNSVIKVGRKFASAKIKDLNVQVSITHQDIGDLQLFLYGPNGQSAVLSSFNENTLPGTGTTPPFFSLGTMGPTTFDDQALLFINDVNSCPADPDVPGGTCAPTAPPGAPGEARAPYAGSFKPEDGTLAGLGSRLMGNWILTIVDGDAPLDGPGDLPDTGTLNNWKIIAQLKGGGGKKK